MIPQQKITDKILGVTVTIQHKFPELYDHLNETPLFLSYKKMFIGMADYQQYLESIQLQLAEFEKLEG